MSNYRGEQSDDSYQRHNANRHHREESGQDRFGQQQVLYKTEGLERAGAERYHLLRRVESTGSRDGQWVKEKDLRLVKTTNRGERLFRVA